MKIILCVAIILLAACSPIRTLSTDRGTLRIVRDAPPVTIQPHVAPTVSLVPTVTSTPEVSE